ncbi:MAG: hypothetical protein V1908_04345 [Candidatus Peregrinibacteria bacterium]
MKTPTAPSNAGSVDNIALFSARQMELLEAKKAELRALREEFDSLLPRIRTAAREYERTEEINRGISAIYDRYFKAESLKNIVGRYGRGKYIASSNAVDWEEEGLLFLRECIDQNIFSMSPALQGYLFTRSSRNLADQIKILGRKDLTPLGVRKRVRQVIINTVGEDVDEKDVESLVEKIARRRIEVANLLGYAHAAARNLLLDREEHRKLFESGRTKEQRIEKRKQEEELRKALLEATLRVTEKEFRTIQTRLLSRVRESQRNHLDILYHTFFSHESDEDLARRYPDTTPNQRYQWRKRGRDLVWPFASEALKGVLDQQAR